MEMRERAEKLWQLLDDIDSASDMYKPTDGYGYRRFYEYAMRKVEKRHELLESNGYTLKVPDE